MKDYKNLDEISTVEELRRELFSHYEIDLCIEELESDILTQENWVNDINTQIKLSCHPNTLNPYSNKTFKETYSETIDFINHSKHRINVLKNERVKYLN